MNTDTVKRWPLALLAWLLILGLSGCESRITQANFNRIEIGMSIEEVHAILGSPSESSSINIAGISGTNSTWSHFDTTITVQFLNGAVASKQFEKPD